MILENTRIAESRIFDSSLAIDEVILPVTRIRDLLDNQRINQLIYYFNRYGFCIIDCKPMQNMVEDFLLLTEIFGGTTYHNRADERGIVSVSLIEGFSEYLGTSNKPHPLHTDGPFEKTPPKAMALQCEIPDPVGGFSLLVSCRAIYRYLLRQDYKGLQMLFNPSVFSVQRDNQFERGPIFEIKNDYIQMRFRTNDGKANICIPLEAEYIFNLIKEFVENPQNQLSFKLKEGQILVVDNTSILHGRTEFSSNSPRKLNRLNFDGISLYSSKILFGFQG